MAIEIRVPSVGESISEVFIGEWYVDAGSWVDVDENVVGLETDKATFDVPCPEPGNIVKILVQAGETAAVGDVIAHLEPAPRPEGAGAAAPSKSSSSANTPSGNQAGGHVMPAAARVAGEAGVDAKSATGTGPGGRILKEDVSRLLQGDTTSAARSERRVPMSPMRQTIARRLVEAQTDAALLSTFNECDMTAVKALRSQYQEAFQKKYGMKLGFMSFFVKAVIDALKVYPQVGAQVDGTDLVYKNYFDIGIAIGAGKGLVVPVLRNAERLSFAEVELSIAEYAQRARENKISLADLEGGTFTISNGGVYGSLLSTPIVNPPQSGVLGMHGIFDRPIALNGEVVIRPMMYIALSYDHRVVDGREAVSFLRRVKECIEDPTRLVLEV